MGEALLKELEQFPVRDLEVVGLDHDGVDLGEKHFRAGGLAETALSISQEAAFAGTGLNDALSLQFEISFGDGVAIDPKLLREGPDARERFSGLEGA